MKFDEVVNNDKVKLDEAFTKVFLSEALTGEHAGHRHEYDMEKSGTTGEASGHSHPYEAGSKTTGAGGEDKHTHTLTSDSEDSNKEDKKESE